MRRVIDITVNLSGFREGLHAAAPCEVMPAR